jgi:hypothetical protein
MGCSNYKEKIESDIINLKIERCLIWRERKNMLKRLKVLTGFNFKRKKIPNYIISNSNNDINSYKNKKYIENLNSNLDSLNLKKNYSDKIINIKNLNSDSLSLKNDNKNINYKKKQNIDNNKLLKTNKIIKPIHINEKEEIDKNKINDNEIQNNYFNINNNSTIKYKDNDIEEYNLINYKIFKNGENNEKLYKNTIKIFDNYTNSEYKKLNSKKLKNKNKSTINIFFNKSTFYKEQKNNDSFDTNKSFNNKNKIKKKKKKKVSIKKIKNNSLINNLTDKNFNFPIIRKNYYY